MPHDLTSIGKAVFENYNRLPILSLTGVTLSKTYGSIHWLSAKKSPISID